MIASSERNQRRLSRRDREKEASARYSPLVLGCGQRDDELIKLIKVRWEKEKEQSNLTRRQPDGVSVVGRAKFLPSRLSAIVPPSGVRNRIDERAPHDHREL